jgi:hypothetical protein
VIDKFSGHTYPEVISPDRERGQQRFNQRARRVYEKVGFVLEGTLRDALQFDGQWVDSHLMSILAHEWNDHRGTPALADGAW